MEKSSGPFFDAANRPQLVGGAREGRAVPARASTVHWLSLL
jgi:hypothetical protein